MLLYRLSAYLSKCPFAKRLYRHFIARINNLPLNQRFAPRACWLGVLSIPKLNWPYCWFRFGQSFIHVFIIFVYLPLLQAMCSDRPWKRTIFGRALFLRDRKYFIDHLFIIDFDLVSAIVRDELIGFRKIVDRSRRCAVDRCFHLM